MANDSTPSPLKRWRETKEFKPFGEPPRTLSRVVEGPGPVPKGAVETADEVCDWNVQPEVV